jgi:hypothetical protein
MDLIYIFIQNSQSCILIFLMLFIMACNDDDNDDGAI